MTDGHGARWGEDGVGEAGRRRHGDAGREDDDSSSEAGARRTCGEALRHGSSVGRGEAALPARNGVGERAGCEYVDDEGR